MKSKVPSKNSFLRVNEDWLAGMISSAVIILAPILFQWLFADSDIELPHWLTAIAVTAGALGAVIAYFRARLTNTLAAQIVAGLITALIEAYAIVELFEWLATVFKH